MGDIKIRRATINDRRAVLEGIEHTLYGLDYLPAYFDEFVSSQDFMSFVAVEGYEIVGFYAAQFVDGGKTVCKRGSRVKKCHRGKGVFTKLSEHIDQEVKKMQSVRNETMTCVKHNAERVAKAGYVQEKGYREILRTDTFDISIKIKDIPPVNLSSFPNTIEMAPAVLKDVFDDYTVCKKIFRQERLLDFYVPLRCIKENVDIFFKDDKFMVMSYRPSTADDQSDSGFSGDVNDITMVSVVVKYRCHLGLRYHMTIFGKDVTDIESHILYHLHKLSELKMELVQWAIDLPSITLSLTKPIIRQCLAQYGITLNRNESFQNTTIIYERDIV